MALEIFMSVQRVLVINFSRRLSLPRSRVDRLREFPTNALCLQLDLVEFRLSFFSPRNIHTYTHSDPSNTTVRHKLLNYNTSLTKPRVPKEEVTRSNTLSLSTFWTDSNLSIVSSNSGFATRTSPCILRKIFWYVWTTSKSLRDWSR